MSEAMDTAAVRALMEDQLRLSRRLRARVAELEDAAHAPVAVVGMGLRLPPAINSPEAYWEFLRGTDSALSGIPADRPGLRAVHDPSPGRLGRSYVDRAAFLTSIADFDAGFFGISRREARLLDPQQRMLLETSWEALERAGIAVRRADRLDVGIYLGMMTSEYSERNEDRSDTSRIDPYYITGGGLSFGAGRVSHLLGFSGPVMGVETACSSSMTTLHLAVQGLRRRECRYALAAGANLLLSGSLMVSLCQTRALAPDGRSKSFLATADGYGRGEGVGVVALMRLDDAEREGRPVLAVIRGTAVNHDGAASGLTAPNGPAQQEVIRAALADARVSPADIGYVEAHGTGTVLGDPIEIGALDGVLGAAVRRRGTPLSIGSVKSRLGHLEGASGIASVMKTVLMLGHGVIPAAADPADGDLNPHIDWERLAFDVPRHHAPWPAELPRRVAGVNSFGMSGTNVHAVLETYEPPATATAPAPARLRRPELLVLSAKDPSALDHLADRIGALLRTADDARIADVCHTLRAGRAPFPYRLAVVATGARELAEALADRRAQILSTAAAGEPPRRITLRAEGPPDALAAVIAELTAAHPLLRDGQAPPAASPDHPAETLRALLTRLGVPTSPSDGPRPETTGGPGRQTADGPGRQTADRPAQDTEDQPAPDAAHRVARIELSWEAHGRRTTLPLAGPRPQDAPELLATALAALFTAGADPRLAPLAAPGAHFVADLPTYPFRPTRYWIDEPRDTARTGPATGTATGVPLPDSLAPEPLTRHLLDVLGDVLQADDLDPGLSFLDVGGDSFLSTLFITRVEEHFEVGMTAGELSLDLPLRDLLGKLAESIAATAEAGQEVGA
ncbi:beta-ketoacyl synthase N-terminal-like domain-containing protein [Streptomyces sp. DSM 41014]|uniref:Beta-ketoacyl synthase N-terminal-like domain-containing protein n=1 Tax=Streptomyces hintoniae TaxID=3075521 RepID=A0ABU2UK74_9ACTN|nr:beta-ketoacyl synthase N-terminal-like domain-containing protein [Streptomyces sp. DSM 41014]MDT0473609.1 beta-ketoacyl synthase N-terminal-like domain-containing protein [Streptomyces sp. DSM 41014]